MSFECGGCLHGLLCLGSHALVDAINAYPCTRYFTEESIPSDSASLEAFLGPYSWERAAAAVVTDENPLLKKNMDAYKEKMWNKTASEEVCSCESRGLLVRTTVEEIENDWCDSGLFFNGERAERVRVMVLIRGDLLRYALSGYGRVDPNFLGNPQFFGNQGVTDTVHEYDPDFLEKSVNVALNKWMQTINKIKALQRCGIKPIVSMYEAFDDAFNHTSLPDTFITDLVPCADNKHQALLSLKPTVTKVHSHDLAAFAVNSRQVYDTFNEMGTPSFGELAKENGLDIKKLEWL